MHYINLRWCTNAHVIAYVSDIEFSMIIIRIYLISTYTYFHSFLFMRDECVYRKINREKERERERERDREQSEKTMEIPLDKNNNTAALIRSGQLFFIFPGSRTKHLTNTTFSRIFRGNRIFHYF